MARNVEDGLIVMFPVSGYLLDARLGVHVPESQGTVVACVCVCVCVGWGEGETSSRYSDLGQGETLTSREKVEPVGINRQGSNCVHVGRH